MHLAAETAGGFEEHRRNSVDATECVIRAAAKAGVKRVIHVSSLAVLWYTIGTMNLDLRAIGAPGCTASGELGGLAQGGIGRGNGAL